MQKIVIPKGFVGKTVITITSPATANCEECIKKITVNVNPAPVKLSKVKNSGKGKVLVKWKKAGGKAVTGYEIAIADNEEFDNARSVKIKGISKVSKTVSKMIAGKTYYVRVRTFQKEKRKTYYYEWSKVKQVTIKN